MTLSELEELFVPQIAGRAPESESKWLYYYVYPQGTNGDRASVKRGDLPLPMTVHLLRVKEAELSSLLEAKLTFIDMTVLLTGRENFPRFEISTQTLKES